MNFNSWCEQIEDFHDQSLAVDDMESFRQHLADCLQCQADLAILKKTDSDLAVAWNRVVLPDVAVTTRRTGSSPGRQARWAPLGQAAAAILLLASAVALAIIARTGSDKVAETLPPDKPLVEPASESLPIKFVGDQPRYASVDFAEEVMAVSVGSTPELTVYSVIPKTTYPPINNQEY